jgi:hypothetical protein
VTWSRGQCFHRICERTPQPISLVLPDLFQDRLTKLTEYTAHLDMIIGATAQHVLRVAPVAQRLQSQVVSVLKAVHRTLDACQ